MNPTDPLEDIEWPAEIHPHQIVAAYNNYDLDDPTYGVVVEVNGQLIDCYAYMQAVGYLKEKIDHFLVSTKDGERHEWTYCSDVVYSTDLDMLPNSVDADTLDYTDI